MISNSKNLSTIQAARDLVAAAAERGNMDAARMIEGGIELLSDTDIEAAEAAYAAHQYPDHALEWGRFYVSGAGALPFDYLDADSAYLAQWIARHISGFSNVVAFKVSTLLAMQVGGYKHPWSRRKLEGVLSDLQAAGVLVVVDRSYTAELGTVYMLDPGYIDMAGTQSRRTQQEKQYEQYSGGYSARRERVGESACTYADMQAQRSGTYVQPITILLGGGTSRARVSWFHVPDHAAMQPESL